jgi:hypothetical protein
MIVITSGENEMNKITKIFFWTFTILLGFVNPLISVVLVVIYYLPKIIQDACNPCSDVLEETEIDYNIKSYSDDILEDMK